MRSDERSSPSPIPFLREKRPFSTSEFGTTGVAGDTSDAAGAMDLLSVIVHELGHVLDLDAHAELSETLAVGSRLMPSDPAPEAPVPALSPAMAYAIRVGK